MAASAYRPTLVVAYEHGVSSDNPATQVAESLANGQNLGKGIRLEDEDGGMDSLSPHDLLTLLDYLYN